MTTNTAVAPATLLRSGTYKRFQVMAWVTGTVLAFMFVVTLASGYLLNPDAPDWYRNAWTLHGFLYMIYLVTVLDVAIRAGWTPGRTVLVALAGTIPFLSFVFERRITHQLQAEVAR